jgi:hypothetical protein
VQKIIKAPTCKESGLAYDYCTKCQDSSEEYVIDPVSHTGDTLEVVFYPIFDTEGTVATKCIYCKNYFDEIKIPNAIRYPNEYTVTDIDEHTKLYSHQLYDGTGVVSFELSTDYQFSLVRNNNNEIVGVSATGCDSSIIQAVIPSTFLNYNVVSVSGGGFTHCTSISIPDSIKTLEENAFKNCTLIEEIVIPNSVTTMENGVFMNCTNLKNVTIGTGITSIGSNCFNSCSNLNEITIPGNVTTIGSFAFSACANLEKITINEGVNSIRSYAFKDCDALQEIIFPNSVTEIKNNAFEFCNSLSKIV